MNHYEKTVEIPSATPERSNQRITNSQASKIRECRRIFKNIGS
ncbi:MAG TPA: hypothetical protein VJ729_04765 [Nitrososphaeraceae archaeon]|nr:hypothetical protein [Nitrososphaeraceae archaeon]